MSVEATLHRSETTTMSGAAALEVALDGFREDFA